MWWRVRKFFTCVVAGFLFIAMLIGIPLLIFIVCFALLIFGIYGNIDYSGLEEALQNQCPALEIDLGEGSYDSDPMLSYYHHSGVSCFKYSDDTDWECGCNSSD